jgi:hypothetical protein
MVENTGNTMVLTTSTGHEKKEKQLVIINSVGRNLFSGRCCKSRASTFVYIGINTNNKSRPHIATPMTD